MKYTRLFSVSTLRYVRIILYPYLHIIVVLWLKIFCVNIFPFLARNGNYVKPEYTSTVLVIKNTLVNIVLSIELFNIECTKKKSNICCSSFLWCITPRGLILLERWLLNIMYARTVPGSCSISLRSNVYISFVWHIIAYPIYIVYVIYVFLFLKISKVKLHIVGKVYKTIRCTYSIHRYHLPLKIM